MLHDLPLGSLVQWMREESLAVAATLFCLSAGPRRAALVDALPVDMRTELLRAVAQRTANTEQGLEDLLEAAREKLGREDLRAGQAAGKERLGLAFPGLPSDLRQRLLDGLRERAPELAGFLAGKLVSVERIASLLPADLARVCAGLADRDLILALRTEPEAVRAIFLRAVSRTRAEELRRALELGRPEKRADVDAAVRKVASVAENLRESGSILFPWEDDIVA